MTRQEKTQRLVRYRTAAERERRLREELARWRAAGERMGAAADGMPRAKGRASRVEEAAVHIVDLQRELGRETERLACERAAALRAMRTVENDELRYLLELRYIDGLTFEAIAEKTCYSVRQTLRRHALALDELRWEDAG